MNAAQPGRQRAEQERKTAEEAGREREEWYRALFEFGHDAILLSAPDGQIFAANPEACQMFGRSEEEICRAGRAGLVDGADSRLPAFLGERARTGKARGELTLVCKDGATFPGEVSSGLFSDRHGNIRSCLIIRDLTERKRAEEALRGLSGQLLRAQDEERRRIARELHDTTAQGLTALLMDLSLVNESAPGINDKTRQLLAGAVALAEQCARELRTFSYLLHPPMLDELGLEGAMRDYVDGFARRGGLRLELELPPDLERLPGETELALFRVLQEALTNIRRHSGRRTASIRLVRTATELRLEVRDQGRGVEAAGKLFAGHSPGGALGVGVTGMRERMRQLGGRLEIESDDHGTCVIAIAPVPAQTPGHLQA